MRSGVGKLSQAQFWKLRWIGFWIFAVSFFVPASWNDLQFLAGAIVFVQTPVLAISFFGEKNYLVGVVMLAAWLANLSVAAPRQKWVALPAILAVWVAYGVLFEMLSKFIPFYPWAIGITMVQVANLLRRESEAVHA